MHGIIGGASGFGKSTMIKILAEQILREGSVRLWLIDPKEVPGIYLFSNTLNILINQVI